jgi:hypothetical protein
MSEEKSGNGNVERLKKELKEQIDHRIEYNNGFANLLRGDYSLFLSLIALILSVYGAWKLGFLARHYALSVYLMFGIWLLYSIISGIIQAPKRAPRERELEDLNKLIGIKTHLKGINLEKFLENVDPEKIRVLVIWGFKWFKPMFYSLGTLFLLSIPMLLIIGEKRWWLWVLAISFTLILLLIVKKGPTFFVASIDEVIRSDEMHKIMSKAVCRWRLLLMGVSFLVLLISGIYLYYILRELFFIILGNLFALFEVILTMFLILLSLAFLSEYLSMKFMVTEVSKQNYKLSVLRMGIDRIEDAKTLEKNKKELLKWYLPKADSFLVFFNYYYLMLTPHIFEVGEEEEEEEPSGA